MQEILPGIWHWTARHPRTGMDVSSYFLPDLELLLDPLTPPEVLDQLEELGPPRYILLTNRHHYRSCPELVERFGCTVRVPRVGLYEFDDHDPVLPYDFGQELNDGTVQVHEVGGISADESALFIPSVKALAVADGLVSHDGLQYMPDEYFDDPENDKKELGESYSRLVSELDFDVLLPAHGEPVTSGAREQLRELATA